jgi:WD40 repeat protein
MKKTLYISILFGLCLVLAACQTSQPQPVFTPGTDVTTTPMTYSPTAAKVAATLHGRISAFAVSPDQKTIAFATSAGVELYDLSTFTYLRTLLDGINVISLDWSADGQYLATSSILAYNAGGTPQPQSGDWGVISETGGDADYGKARIEIWKTSNWEKSTITLANNDLKNERYLYLAWSPDSPYLAVTSDVHGVFVLDVTSGAVISKQGEFASSVRQVSWSPDGSRIIATNDLAYGLRRWVVSSDESVRLYDQRMSSSMIVAWSPDGQRIASGDSLGNVCLWTASTNQCDGFIKAHRSAVFSLVWSPDSTRLATGAGVIRIWDTGNGQLIEAFGEYEDMRYSQIEWPNISGPLITLQTSLEDESITVVRLWDVKTGMIMIEFDGA